MTERTDMVRTHDGRGVLVLSILVLAAFFLAPSVWVWSQALDTVRHPSSFDWKSNHDNHVQFAVVSAIVFGTPLTGAFLGGIVASARGKHGGVGAATGAFLGALGLLLCGVVGFVWMFSNATFEF
ncbi:hypothetical protein AB0A70_15295 [Streptomyces morookaense]|uniref:hypothetical protein n=1 Tax=Streptomyces morookaense TaxID=1970 RepID=UPI0033E40660